MSFAVFIISGGIALALTACSGLGKERIGEERTAKGENAAVSEAEVSEVRDMKGREGIQITLNPDGSAAIKDSGSNDSNHVEVSENTITITRAGRYRVQGIWEEGQLCVDAGKNDEVVLVLAGVELTNTEGAAICVENAKTTLLQLEEGTVNLVRSGKKAMLQELENSKGAIDLVEEDALKDAEGAAIYAKDDLSIAGAGELKVIGGINNGIHTKNHLAIEGGELEVRALNHGVKGKDSVTIDGGSFLIFSGGDGIRSDDDSNEDYGKIAISGGSFLIHSRENGVRAKSELVFSGGALEVAESYEGMEANQIAISGGSIDINALDDGINANGGPENFDKELKEKAVEEGLPNLVISGGQVHVDAKGDGLDSNGNIYVEGGVTVIDGPESDKDGPLDYGHENGGVCLISGGTVLAIGSSGMAETFGADSSQCSFRYIFDNPYQAGSDIVISDQEGKSLFEHQALKKGASVVFSSPELEEGEIYELEVDGERVLITIS